MRCPVQNRHVVTSSLPAGREYPVRPIVSAHAIVLHGDAILLVRRAHAPGPGRWSVPGGAVELGETIQEAARREVREECGIDVDVTAVADVVDSIIRDERGQVRVHFVVVYLFAGYASGDVRAGSDAADVLWATRGQLVALDMSPVARRVVERAFDAVSLSQRAGTEAQPRPAGK